MIKGQLRAAARLALRRIGSGSRSLAVAVPLLLSGCGGGSGGGGEAEPASTGAPASVVFSANPSEVTEGQTSLLSWTSTNATSCTASGAWSGDQPVNGSVRTEPLQTTQTFTLSCNGPNGGAVARVTIEVIAAAPPEPTLAFTASPTSVQRGDATTLSWSTTNATACTATGAWSGNKATSGSESTGTLAASAAYTLSCEGPGGTVSEAVAVSVEDAQAPTLSLTASPPSLPAQGSSQLSWSSTRATGCTASGAWSGGKPTSGNQSTGTIGKTSTYTLTCNGAGGTIAQSATVTVGQGAAPATPTLSFTASASSIAAQGTAQLTWTASNATSCAASGAWSGAKQTSGTASVGPIATSGKFTLTCSGQGGSIARTVNVAVVPPPTLSLSASPSGVAPNAASRLNWAATDATSCTASDGWSGSRTVTGSESTSKLTTATTYTLSCSGIGGSVSRAVTVAVGPKPAVTLSANPPQVASQGTAQLTWQSTDSTSCTASGAWSGTKPTAGSQAIGPLAGTSTYSLACSGAGGSASSSVTVEVAPQPTLTLGASASSVTPQGSATLTWSASNATSCTASGAWSGGKGLSGSQSTGPISAKSTFTLTCSGNGGSVAKSVTIDVVAPSAPPPPSLTFASSAASVAPQGSVTLSWSSANATGCVASGAWSGNKGTSGSQSTGALGARSTFTLECSGSGGAISRSVTVDVVAPAPTLSLTASPGSIASQGSAALNWTATNATGCTASGAWTGSKPTSGSQTTGSLTQSATYTLVCAGAGGSVSRSVTVSVQPIDVSLTLSATPRSVAANGTSSLSWTSSGLSSCTASGGWSGSRPVNGTETTAPIGQDTSFALNCNGDGESAVAMATVVVREARLSWQAPTKNVDGSALTDLAGYKVHYGTAPRNYTQTITVSGATSVQRTISLSPGTWYFAVTAVNSKGQESAYSGEVSKTIPQ